MSEWVPNLPHLEEREEINMNYNFSIIRKGIILVEAESQYALCSMFLRPQEYYESPYKNICGKYFTLEEYMDTYANDRGAFTYYTDWCGFNIPSEVFVNFVNLFQFTFNTKENLLVNGIRNLIPNLEGKFYIIGVCKGKWNKETLDHETAHALWYLDPVYRDKMSSLLYNKVRLYLYEKAKISLESVGYDKKVINDELHAYIATASRKKILRLFGWGKDERVSTSIRKYFKEYCASHK